MAYVFSQRRFKKLCKSGNFDRNGWKLCGGMTGNFRALWVETFHRNQWKLCSGIITSLLSQSQTRAPLLFFGHYMSTEATRQMKFYSLTAAISTLIQK